MTNFLICSSSLSVQVVIKQDNTSSAVFRATSSAYIMNDRDTSRRPGRNPSTRRPLVIRDLKFPLKRTQSNSIQQGHNVDAGSKILMETNAHIYFETGPAGYKGSVVLKRGLSISNDRTIYIRIVLPWVLQKTRLFPPAREKEQEKVLCISGD